jgi:hypothetical protein
VRRSVSRKKFFGSMVRMGCVQGKVILTDVSIHNIGFDITQVDNEPLPTRYNKFLDFGGVVAACSGKLQWIEKRKMYF